MNLGSFRFDRFVLDDGNRLLLADGVPVDLSSRYFDALSMMLRECGGLVTKERFMDEVWRGVPVTDEALTQCIKTLRRVLGDDAARPRFIETVPKHGYRFIAPVQIATNRETELPAGVFDWRKFAALAGAGLVGGGMAGLIGGILYGFIGAAQPFQSGMSGGSILLVLTAISVSIGLVGAAGVSCGIAAALVRGAGWQGFVAGGAIGGLAVGAIVKLLGIDAFRLLLGASPGNVTGAVEGAAIGAAVGLGVWASSRQGRTRLWPAALVGAAAGVIISALGGNLLGGSLDLLAHAFPQSRLQLGQMGQLFGEAGFGVVSRIATGALEGGLFAGCVASALLIARRQFED